MVDITKALAQGAPSARLSAIGILSFDFRQSRHKNEFWRCEAVNGGRVMHERPRLFRVAKNESVFSFQRSLFE